MNFSRELQCAQISEMNVNCPHVTAKLSLEGYSPHNLRYLQCGDTRQDEAEDAARFQAWKACLGMYHIPVLYMKTRNTVNYHYNRARYNGLNLAVYICEF